MAAVAARAKVAVQTVYFVFHTKIELLTEVFDTAVQAHRERLRVAGYRALTTAFNDRKALRPNVDVDTATDILLALVGPAIYGSLVGERGWTHERYLDWATNALTELLLKR